MNDSKPLADLPELTRDLADIASPTLISDILAGRRDISKRLAKLLSQRFHLDIGAFV